MNLYYHTGTLKKIEAILADGFIDETRIAKSNRAPGVYVADLSGQPDPKLLDDHLLEISLPEVIDISSCKLVPPPGVRVVDYGEWLIPSSILNQHARLRLVAKDEWTQLGAKQQLEQIEELNRELVADGLLEHAKDAQGKPLYRQGQPVWRITPKGIELAKATAKGQAVAD